MKNICKLYHAFGQNSTALQRNKFRSQGLLRAAVIILLGLLYIIGMEFLTSKSFTEVIVPN